MFGFKLHWGDPKHPTEVRAWTGCLTCGGVEEHCFTTHQVGRWYGLSHRRDWFLGISLFSRSESYRAPDAPRIGMV